MSDKYNLSDNLEAFKELLITFKELYHLHDDEHEELGLEQRLNSILTIKQISLAEFTLYCKISIMGTDCFYNNKVPEMATCFC